LANFLAQQKHLGVARHLLLHCRVQGVAHRHLSEVLVVVWMDG
jgi:hypothetical protein